jgi:hypothetical protein
LLRFVDQRKLARFLAFRIFNAKKAEKEMLYPDLLSITRWVMRQADRGLNRAGEADQILAQRKQIIEAAKAANPQRWSGQIRNLSLPESVTLNPEKAASC